MRRLSLALLVASMPAVVAAQSAPTEPGAPLAEIRDEKQLAATLSAITQDPAIPVDDPQTRGLAQALMVEGVKQLQARAFDQALANFLEAYAKFPSPKILLNVAGTLRDMGRLADAANTYQRYLTDPATGAERIAEVKELLLRLDEQLTILTVRVFPSGSDVSIDGGPFVPVGTSLLTRVRPGIHLVRVKKDTGSNEITVNGFEGENKEVSAAVKMEVVDTPPPPPNPNPNTNVSANPEVTPKGTAAPPEHVEGWLITGTQYAADSANGRERRVRAGFAGPEVAPIVPHFEMTDTGDVIVESPHEEGISSGVIAALRIDGEGRGAAGAIGLAFSKHRFEAEVMFLRSDSTGGYVGARYRLWTWVLRPYVGVGLPAFLYDSMNSAGETSTKLAVGLRGALGVELKINGHLSVQGDVGYEHFFIDQEKTGIDANVLVPTLGVIGRL